MCFKNITQYLLETARKAEAKRFHPKSESEKEIEPMDSTNSQWNSRLRQGNKRENGSLF